MEGAGYNLPMPATNTAVTVPAAELAVIVVRNVAGQVIDIIEAYGNAQAEADAMQWENYDEVAYDLRKARKYPTYKGEITARRYYTVATITDKVALRHIAALDAQISFHSQDEAQIEARSGYEHDLFTFLCSIV